ncbi:Mor transcription activator family protein [Serratia ficaria]|uniref:Mor transcription activator family protein n=1 Tax=Serratia ficaria TaxID=61651 RepID=UPI002179F5E2|nr:Mor transcription activator family protein [Serratia ficaria]CAI0791492.1 Uncharacterized conserved protein [Serratia ficaria]CAI1237376.1 Uncharacterized conserved protein [Serratia ficaria]CAI2024251.1 Uncharacterized conserved protein [Serratia ficaria]CAI2407981.1 Uncharacterized conserved protein [Serratia ficaria]CAI2438833.1 Uncharacterized conserved protein [Serratia ficaria]
MADNLELFDDELNDSILDHMGGGSENAKFPSLLLELNALLRSELEKLGDEPQHSIDLVIAISRHIGGIQVYLPKGQALEYLVRDMKIWRDFDGRNVSELAMKYRVTFKTVYKAINRMRKLESKKHQPDLF